MSMALFVVRFGGRLQTLPNADSVKYYKTVLRELMPECDDNTWKLFIPVSTLFLKHQVKDQPVSRIPRNPASYDLVARLLQFLCEGTN